MHKGGKYWANDTKVGMGGQLGNTVARSDNLGNCRKSKTTGKYGVNLANMGNCRKRETTGKSVEMDN